MKWKCRVFNFPVYEKFEGGMDLSFSAIDRDITKYLEKRKVKNIQFKFKLYEECFVVTLLYVEGYSLWEKFKRKFKIGDKNYEK